MVIYCKNCKLFVHKKCKKLKQSELKRLKPGEWECTNHRKNDNDTFAVNYNYIDINELNKNINVVEVDFTKNENMAFDPLRFESTTMETNLNNDEIQININCKYTTNNQLNQMLSNLSLRRI